MRVAKLQCTVLLKGMLMVIRLLVLLISLLPFFSYAADFFQRQKLGPYEAIMKRAELKKRIKVLEDELWEAISYQQTFDSARVAQILFEPKFEPQQEKSSKKDQKNSIY